MKNCRPISVNTFVFSMCDTNHFYSAYNIFLSVRNFPKDFEHKNWCMLPPKELLLIFLTMYSHIYSSTTFFCKEGDIASRHTYVNVILRQTNAKICITAPHSNSFVII